MSAAATACSTSFLEWFIFPEELDSFSQIDVLLTYSFLTSFKKESLRTGLLTINKKKRKGTSKAENSHAKFTQINYARIGEENNTLKEIETIKNENNQLKERLEEKEKLIKQLMNGNKTLQEL